MFKKKLIIITSYCILNINKKKKFLSITFNLYILLIKYSSFLFKIFTLIFFILLIYKI